MRKQTDLDEVKRTAITLLYTDIYLTAEYLNNEEYYHDYYTEVEISYAASKAHPKSAIQVRNRKIVDRADLIFCAIEQKSGGVWQTVRYAIKQGKTVVNICDFTKKQASR